MEKHIKSYSKFLFEQEIPGLPGEPADGTAPKKEKRYRFLFIDALDDFSPKRYPDGSLEYSLPSYSITQPGLEQWADKNITTTDKNKMNDSVVKLRKDNLINIVKGKKVNISKDDEEFIEKLKNAVATDIFGKREPNVTVIFTKAGIPLCDKIDVTFIEYKKS
jgi:hypothetical protein